MSISTIKQALLATLFLVVVLPAQAVAFVATPPDSLGPFNGGSLTETIVSPGTSAPGGATLTFDLLGYLSVDGANCCTDTFTLTINGNTLFSGGFDMGGGVNFVNFQDPSVTIVSTGSFGFFGGGLTQFSVAHQLLTGNNTYVFDYGQMQGLGDEGWGLRNIVVTADVAGQNNVPEPATLALFGIALAGIARTRRRKA